MPAVSVITPAYNVEAYLADAASTVLVQTFRDLELIIVDDGSTDRTPGIAEACRRRDPARVRVITQKNRGLSSARNAAMHEAKGAYFALLDSDDLWEPEFLASQMRVFAAHPDVDLVTGNGRNLGGRLDGRTVRPWPDRRPPITLANIIGDEEAVFVMTVFHRRVYETIGGFDEGLRTNEDYDYWIRAAAAGFRFARNPRPLAWYRRRDDSLSASDARMLAGILKVYERTRRLCPAGSAECRALDAQVARFERERCAAEARLALASGDSDRAARWLGELAERRPRLTIRIAAFLARRAPSLLRPLYDLWSRRPLRPARPVS
jgi:glycosyltransferase involved in cell wall biosynthesis